MWVLDIFCTFLIKNEKNNQSPHWGRDSGIPDLQHPRLGKHIVDCKSWTLGRDSLFSHLRQSFSCISGRLHFKNLPWLCTGTGKSTRVSKICSPQRGLPSRGRCKSLTRGWVSLSLYKSVVDYFSPTSLNPHNKTTLFAFKNTSKRCLLRQRRQFWLIITPRNCVIYDVTRCLLKRSCLYRGR